MTPGHVAGIRTHVQGVRHLLAHRRLVMVLCAAALVFKLLVPTGYMIAVDHGRLAIVACPGTAPAPQPIQMHGGHGGGHDTAKDHDKADQPCAFAGLSAAATGAIDPIQLVVLLAFVMALGLSRAALPSPATTARLRPPLRGPPIRL
ncbi:hypothetical protein ACFSC3_00985 [Sphingomonas floccifaciens]|uniref:DUF2946 domain-containing protein n=1 Tax=Sphingomonas floccifaciens TaxID=1844115 RepID=A0ABW4N7Y2_9SPHN